MFKSRAQIKHLTTHAPEVAKKFAAKTFNYNLPNYVKGSKHDPMNMLKAAITKLNKGTKETKG